MHFRHLSPFQKVDPESALTWLKSTHQAPLNTTSGSNAVAIHFLGVDCGCSEIIYRSLLLPQDSNRVRLSDESPVSQSIFLFPSETEPEKTVEWQNSLQARGFKVKIVGVNEPVPTQAVPGLIVASVKNVELDNGVVRSVSATRQDVSLLYSGGYTEKRVSDPTRVHSAELIQRVLSGETVVSRPSFGCAVSKSLQNSLKPELALKKYIQQITTKGPT